MGDNAIVLVSGGMDSLVTAAIAAKNFKLAFLHINYGQRTERRELKSFNDIADYITLKYGWPCGSQTLWAGIKVILDITGGSQLTTPMGVG